MFGAHAISQVYKVSNIVSDLIKGYEAEEGYVCQASSAAGGARRPPPAVASAASGSAASEGEIGSLLVKYAGLLPRMREQLELSDHVGYQVESRATEILKQWLRRGQDKGAMTSTVAAAALWMAKEALVKESSAASVALNKLEMAAVAKAAGLKGIDPIRKLLAAYADKPPPI